MRTILNMFQDFHTFTKSVWNVWFAGYVGFILFKISQNIIPWTFMGSMDSSNVYLLDIIYSMHKAALWLIPTMFLFAAVQLSRPNIKASQR